MDNINHYKEKIALSRLRDPKFYLENYCKIKTKDRSHGGLSPFILNEAQKDIFNTLRHENRIIILKARQIGFCLSEHTRVLLSNLKWVEIKDINVGDEIIAVDENSPVGRGKSRKMRSAIVEGKSDVYEDAIKLTMDDGRELIATEQHRFLSKKWTSGTDTIWKQVSTFRVGDEIRYITKPWREGDFEDGWFGGLLDGEGSLSKKSRTGVSLSISQVGGPVWERMLRYVRSRNYNFRIECDKRLAGDNSKLGNKPVWKVVFSRMDEVFRVLGQTRPERFIGRTWWNDKVLPGKGSGWSKIIKIESLGKRRMIDLQTSAKTYIAEGFVSHNSTAVTGFLYHDTIMNPGTNTALIGYNSDLTTELLDKVKTFVDSTPEEVRPTIEYNSKTEMSFPKIKSTIRVLPSTSNAGRGYTLHNVLVTELPFWEKQEEKMVSLENSVPATGRLVIESTPAGVGDQFHRMWVSDDNGYVKKAYDWRWGYTEEQIDYIRKRMNNPRKFAQEYELEFLASGRNVFDMNVVKAQRRNIWSVGETHDDPNNPSIKDTVTEWERLRVYRSPRIDKTYVVGADVSEGIDGGDYSVAVIWDRETGEEVAFFRGLLPPDRFGDYLNKWGRFYNNALMCVEINNHGLTTITTLKNLLYPSLYFRPAKFDAMANTYSDRIGWKTTRITKSLLIDDFAQALRDGVLTIHSKEMLDEMTVFVYNANGDMVPQETFHDDTIFAAGIGFQGFKILYTNALEQIDYSHHLPKNYAY